MKVWKENINGKFYVCLKNALVEKFNEKNRNHDIEEEDDK